MFKKLLLILFVFVCANGFAQQQQGQVTCGVTVGYSPLFEGAGPNYLGYPISTFASYDNNWHVSSHTANVGGNIEYCLVRRLSMGVAASYQDETVSYEWNYSDFISRVNVAGRLLFQLNRNKKWQNFSNYIGIRDGYSYYHDDASPYSIAPFINSVNRTISTIQFLYGIRFYEPHGFEGLGLEIGIGEPYFISGGCMFRINTKKQVSTAPAAKGLGG